MESLQTDLSLLYY